MNNVNWKIDNNWIHIISIAGKALGQMAVAYANQGYFVTGSDPQFFDPIKSHIEKYPEIKIKREFSYKNLIKSTYSQTPDKKEDEFILPGKVIAGGGLSRKNKEILFAKKQNLNILNFAQDLEEVVCLDENNIVIAGSFGKSTTTAGIIYLLNELEINISYMLGALGSQIENGVKLKDKYTKYAILEGDEYFAARDDLQSKFNYYHPKFLILTGYAYDHTDFFETKEDYKNNFQKLVNSIPNDGIIIWNKKYPELEEIVKNKKTTAKDIPYEYRGQLMPTNLIGEFNQENLLAIKTFITELRTVDNGIDQKLEIKGLDRLLSEFKGIKRRLEIIGNYTFKQQNNNDMEFTVINDFGSTPGKAKSAINAVKKNFPEYNIICYFMPNQGSRTKIAIPEFLNVFDNADLILIPEFREIKNENLLSTDEFISELKNLTKLTKIDIKKINSNQDIINYSVNRSNQNVFLILSSDDVSNVFELFRIN